MLRDNGPSVCNTSTKITQKRLWLMGGLYFLFVIFDILVCVFPEDGPVPLDQNIL
jgi:hypothetical protein